MELWDRSRAWCLLKFTQELRTLTVHFSESCPALSELVALRQCIPGLASLSPGKLRAEVGNSPTYELRNVGAVDASKTEGSLRAAGFEVDIAVHVSVGYLPYDKTSKVAWLIEDDSKARMICDEMLASGVPVIERDSFETGQGPDS